MAFTSEIINRFSQFGVTYFDVLVKDGEKTVHREERKFNKTLNQCTKEDFDLVGAEVVSNYEAFLEANKPLPALLDTSYITPLIEFIEAANPDILKDEFQPLIDFLNRNNPGMLQKDFPAIVAYLNNKYPGFIDVFKSQQGIN